MWGFGKAGRCYGHPSVLHQPELEGRAHLGVNSLQIEDGIEGMSQFCGCFACLGGVSVSSMKHGEEVDDVNQFWLLGTVP